MISSSYLAVVAAGVTPNESNYLILSLISGGILDVDHLWSLVKDRDFYKKNGYSGNLHRARSVFHELIGLFFAGLVMLIVSFFNPKLALVLGLPFMIHLVEDILMGVSAPFIPIDKTKIQLLPQKKTVKIVMDLLVTLIFGILWIKYLNGQQ